MGISHGDRALLSISSYKHGNFLNLLICSDLVLTLTLEQAIPVADTILSVDSKDQRTRVIVKPIERYS